MISELDRLTHRIIGAAVKVHKALGPGLLESTYEMCLLHELTQERLRVERQKEMPVALPNLQYFCLKCGKAVRIGYKLTGAAKVRFCRKCGEAAENAA